MGTFAAEMCAPYCLPLVLNPMNDTESECAYILVKEFLKCLTAQAVKTLILPTIQKILQASCKLYFTKFSMWRFYFLLFFSDF